jgi:hypothetical protein
MISKIERWAPIGGIVFVVLMVVGSIFVIDVPSADASEQEITDYLADSDNQMRNIIGVYMWVVGALVFLWFLMRLRSDIRRAEGGTGTLSTLTFGAGVVFAAVWMVSASVLGSVAYAVELRDAPVEDIDLVRVLLPMGGLILLLGGGFAGVLLLLAVSTAILTKGVYPKWLGWLGIIAAIVLLFDVVYGTIFPFWTWVIIASIVMLIRREKTATTAAPQQTSAQRVSSGEN